MAQNKKFTLFPNNGRKSFYGKMYVTEQEDGTKILTNYQTEVMKITPNGVLVRLWNGYSATTQRHIDAFLDYYGLAKYRGKKACSTLRLEA